MSINEIVEKAWLRTVNEFEKARKNADAWLWTEEALRLHFFKNLNEQNIKIITSLAETPYHIGDSDYKPDLVVYIKEKDEVYTVVFEMKYFGRNWKDDWEKLQAYGYLGHRWNYGYFLAIGRSWQCDEIPKFKKHKILKHSYEVRSLTHSTPALRYAPDFKIAEGLLRSSLKDVSYTVTEELGAVALYKDVLLYFDLFAKEGKCVVWAAVPEEVADQKKLVELGYDKWITFDDEGLVHLSKKYTGRIMIGEFEATTYPKNRKAVKNSLAMFRKKIDSVI